VQNVSIKPLKSLWTSRKVIHSAVLCSI